MPYLLLAAAIASEVIGTTFLKLSDGFSRPVPSLVTAIAYAFSFWCLAITLREIPTGVAYAIWSGLGMVLITGVAWLFLGQKLDAAALAGMALIVAGVIVMNLFSRSVPH